MNTRERLVRKRRNGVILMIVSVLSFVIGFGVMHDANKKLIQLDVDRFDQVILE